MSDVRLQSQLGDIKPFDRKDRNMGGTITVGRVIRVHHKNHTADIRLLSRGDVIVGSEETEGINSCRIVENHAGFDERYQVFYGDITPIQEGELVVVAFLENYKARPFILGAVHDIDNDKNPMPVEYPLFKNEELQRYERLSITRLQDYLFMGGNGEFEAVHHSKAFLKASEKELDDNRDGFGYEDLTIKDKKTKKTIRLTEEKRTFKPLNFLLSFRDKFSDAAGFLKLWISAAKGAARLSKDANDGKLTFVELNENGQFRMKRQMDSNKRDTSDNYSQVSLDETGVITTQRMIGGNLTQITIGTNGEVTMSTKQSVDIHGSKVVNVTSDRVINIIAPVVNIG